MSMQEAVKEFKIVNKQIFCDVKGLVLLAWLILGLASHVVIKRIKERRAKDKREGGK